MKTYSQFLAEARMAPLYHGTTLDAVCDILYTDKLKRSRYYSRIEHPHAKDGRSIALTRDLKFAQQWAINRDGNVVVIELDQLKLSQRYKIVPFNFFADETGQTRLQGRDHFENQSEESIIDRDVTDIDNYIVKVILDRNAIAKLKKRENAPKWLLNYKKYYSLEDKRFINV